MRREHKRLNSIQWLHRYLFRGLGLLLLAAAVTILWLDFDGCSTPGRYSRERKAADQSKKTLEKMSRGSDKAIREYRMP